MADKLPVILDTDIGGDIDDTWALAYLLKCPELDLRMVVCSSGCRSMRTIRMTTSSCSGRSISHVR